MKRYLPLIFLLLLTSCYVGCKKLSDEERIAQLAQQLRELTLKEASEKEISDKAQTLAILYRNYIQKHPQNAETQLYLYQAAGITEIYEKNIPKALKLYEETYQTFPQTEVGANALYRSANLYRDSLKQPDKALALFQKYLEEYPYTFHAQQIKDALKESSSTENNEKSISK
jgi:tetratricopeptide (TPR) repeat protein